jgi:hypothetical protein
MKHTLFSIRVIGDPSNFSQNKFELLANDSDDESYLTNASTEPESPHSVSSREEPDPFDILSPVPLVNDLTESSRSTNTIVDEGEIYFDSHDLRFVDIPESGVVERHVESVAQKLLRVDKGKIYFDSHGLH